MCIRRESIMPVPQVIITIGVAGVVLLLVNKYLSINVIIKTILSVVVLIIVWFLAFEVFVSYI